MPVANIARIMKTVLPGNAKVTARLSLDMSCPSPFISLSFLALQIAKDAKETIQECVSEYISFITSEASDKCQQEKRKTVSRLCHLGPLSC